MNQDVLFRDAVAQLHDFRTELFVQPDTPVPVLAEQQRFPVLERQGVVVAPFLFAEVVECAVVEDVAVLVDLDEGRPAVAVRVEHRLFEVRREHVHAASDERGPRAERERDRIERPVHRSEGRGLGLLADFRRRRVLPLGQPIDPVVEQQKLDVHVSAHQMNQVVAADGQRVAVAGDDPHGQIRIGNLDPRRDRRGPAVHRVKPVDVHVIGEAGGTADAGDDDEFLLGHAERREHLLRDVKDRVVAATGTPPNLLVGGEIFLGQLDLAHDSFDSATIRSRISVALKGRPCTLLSGSTLRR